MSNRLANARRDFEAASTPLDVRKAFRRHALRFHSNKNPAPTAHENFIALQALKAKHEARVAAPRSSPSPPRRASPPPPRQEPLRYSGRVMIRVIGQNADIPNNKRAQFAGNRRVADLFVADFGPDATMHDVFNKIMAKRAQIDKGLWYATLSQGFVVHVGQVLGSTSFIETRTYTEPSSARLFPLAANASIIVVVRAKRQRKHRYWMPPPPARAAWRAGRRAARSPSPAPRSSPPPPPPRRSPSPGAVSELRRLARGMGLPSDGTYANVRARINAALRTPPPNR